jgi:hypothetical protein
LFVPKAAFAKPNATFIRCNDAFVLLKASLIVDGAAFVVQSDAPLDQNDAFPIQNASFCIHKEAFAFLDAPNVKERATFGSPSHRSREIGVALVQAAAAFIGRLSADEASEPPCDARTGRIVRADLDPYPIAFRDPNAMDVQPPASLRQHRSAVRAGGVLNGVEASAAAFGHRTLEDEKVAIAGGPVAHPTTRTFSACSPLVPCFTSNSTFCPSERVRKPESRLPK